MKCPLKKILLLTVSFSHLSGSSSYGVIDNAPGMFLGQASDGIRWEYGLILLLLFSLGGALWAVFYYRRLVLTRTSNLMEVNKTLKKEVQGRIKFEQKLESEQVIRAQFLDQLTRLVEMTNELSQVPATDDLCRKAVILCRDRLGIGRIAFWFFEKDRKAMKGSFGVDLQGNLRDERDVRIFDRGSVAAMEKEWRSKRHWYENPEDTLRDGHGRIVGKGKHLTAALWDGNDIIGFVTIDDILKTDMSNPHLGELLAMLGVLFGSLYALKKTEEALVTARDESENASRAKTEFLAMMSHEIRTPMNAIMGFSQLLGMSQRDPRLIEFTDKLMESSRHLLSLINEILDYSKLSSGIKNLNPEPLSLAREVYKILELFEPDAQAKGLKLESSVSTDIPEKALMDKTQLRQILSNLIQNAIKFTNSGFVRILLDGTSGLNPARMKIKLVVEDTGIGIQSDAIEKIFEPFQQANRTITREFGGTGLGLAIVKRLVESMQGTILCESEAGKGSRFILEFEIQPISPPSPDPQSAMTGEKLDESAPTVILKPGAGISVSREENNKKLNIIVAENDHQNQLVILSILKHLGYSAHMSNNGQEVIEDLKKGQYNLVIMDVHMPKINGIEATEQIRQGGSGEENRNIPIIGLSAFASDVDEQRGLAAGMNVYLRKPLRLEQLKTVLSSFAPKE